MQFLFFDLPSASSLSIPFFLFFSPIHYSIHSPSTFSISYCVYRNYSLIRTNNRIVWRSYFYRAKNRKSRAVENGIETKNLEKRNDAPRRVGKIFGDAVKHLERSLIFFKRISAAMSPTVASQSRLRTRKIPSRRLFASAFRIRSNSFSLSFMRLAYPTYGSYTKSVPHTLYLFHRLIPLFVRISE